MSIEQNKEITSRFHEAVVNQKNLSALDDYVANDVVWHNAPPEMAPGIEGFKQFFQRFDKVIKGRKNCRYEITNLRRETGYQWHYS